jgi:GNAT superfamily N-acetyltransferase
VSVGVRRAEARDFGRATELLEELGRVRVTPDTRAAAQAIFEAHVASADANHLVAEIDGEVVGFSSLHFRDRLNHPTPDGWIPDLIVAASARRRGVARALLTEAERICRERGCWSLTLESGFQREEAHVLYEEYGMERMGFYFGKRLD